MLRSILIVGALITLASCTKVINVDLNSSHPQYVVEGEVTNATGPYTIHLTRSVNFSEDNFFPAVTNAIVVIDDNGTNADTLTQPTPGFYNTRTLHGLPGHTYNLKIVVDGSVLSSSSTMPQPVAFDSLYLVTEGGFGKPKPRPHAIFYDPVGPGNYYSFVLYKNDKRLESLVTAADIVNDGLRVDETLRGYDSLNTGDRVRVDMQCIAKPVFDYYSSLRQTIQQNSATPANPISNIKGSNVLGYFSAHTTQVRSLIVP